jgi:hypothetical protein
VKTAAEISSGLIQFIGSQTYTLHWTKRLIYTEGVAWLQEAAECGWLIDLIASHQGDPALEACGGIQFWKLKVDLKTKRARAICIPDTGRPPVVSQEIEYSDFPLESIDLWMEYDGETWTLMLPREH